MYICVRSMGSFAVRSKIITIAKLISYQRIIDNSINVISFAHFAECNLQLFSGNVTTLFSVILNIFVVYMMKQSSSF